MKNMLTLLLAIGVASSVLAQSDRRDDYDDQHREDRNPTFDSRRNGNNEYPGPNSNSVVYDRHDRRNEYDNRTRRYDDSYAYRERDAQIAQINWRYDEKIKDVQRNPFMSHHEKKRIIRNLEHERAEQIRLVYRQFNDRDHDDRFERNKHHRFW